MKNLLFLSILFSVTHCYAYKSQIVFKVSNLPNINGTWLLNMSQSKFAVSKSELGYDELSLVVSQNDPEIRIARKIVKKNKERIQELVYYSDGRSESNPTITGNGIVKSKTEWKSDILIVHNVFRSSLNGDVITTEITDKWELSADGNTLTDISTTVALRSESGRKFFDPHPIIKKVFKRIS